MSLQRGPLTLIRGLLGSETGLCAFLLSAFPLSLFFAVPLSSTMGLPLHWVSSLPLLARQLR